MFSIDRAVGGKGFQGQDFLSHLSSTTIQVFAVHMLMAITFWYFAHDTAPSSYLFLWLIMWCALAVWRLFYYERVLTKPEIDLNRKRLMVLIINFLFGLAQAASVVFFIYFTFVERAVYTMIILGSVSGSVTIIGFRMMFAMFATPIVIALAVAWIIIPNPEITLLTQLIMSALIMFYYVILIADSQSFYDLFHESNSIRIQQKELNLQLNDALEEAQRASESKTRFLASASHDLRQPIHTLSLLSAALLMQKMDEPTERIADRMGQAIDILASQMDSLLDISKFDAGLVKKSASVFDLVAFVRRLHSEYSEICEAKGLELKLSHEVEAATVETDPSLFERIFRNLLSNAIRYTDQGTISIVLAAEGENWKLAVHDTGRGLEVEHHSRIFEEFYQVGNINRDRNRGLGLGLAIAKRITGVLGINISVESELNQGSVFSVELPKVDGALKSSVDIPSIVPRSIEGLRVLCIDDELHVREALEIVLAAKGCIVIAAQNTDEAIAFAREHTIDVVIADLRLADGESGIDAINHVRTIYSELPALLVSGDTAPAQLKLAKSAGINMLHKPLEISSLELEISNLISVG